MHLLWQRDFYRDENVFLWDERWSLDTLSFYSAQWNPSKSHFEFMLSKLVCLVINQVIRFPSFLIGDIIFNARYPELPPDFIFGEDVEFLPEPSELPVSNSAHVIIITFLFFLQHFKMQIYYIKNVLQSKYTLCFLILLHKKYVPNVFFCSLPLFKAMSLYSFPISHGSYVVLNVRQMSQMLITTSLILVARGSSSSATISLCKSKLTVCCHHGCVMLDSWICCNTWQLYFIIP